MTALRHASSFLAAFGVAAMAFATPASPSLAAGKRHTREQCISDLAAYQIKSVSELEKMLAEAMARAKTAKKEDAEVEESLANYYYELKWYCAKYIGERLCKPGKLELINIPPKSVGRDETMTITLGNEENGIAAELTVSLTKAADGGYDLVRNVMNKTTDCVLKSPEGFQARLTTDPPMKPGPDNRPATGLLGIAPGDLANLAIPPKQGTGMIRRADVKDDSRVVAEYGEFTVE